MAKINPMDQLSAGTKVRLPGGKHGHVISCEIVQSHPCGLIALHTILITHKAAGRFKIVALDKPKLIKPNYAFVETI